MNFKVHLSVTIAVGFALTSSVFAKNAPTLRVEPGLEQAIKWKWSVASSDGLEWGLPLRDVPVLQNLQTPSSTQPQPAGNPSVYEIKKGDVLVNIAKRFKLTVAQLKEFNELTSDMIHIGQQLRIPTVEERTALKSTPVARPASAQATPNAAGGSDLVRLRVFLDRQGFSTGPISDVSSPVADRICHIYQTSKGETFDLEALRQRARQSVPDPHTDYILKVADFRFIATPKATRATPTPSPQNTPPKPAPMPPLTYEEMVTSSFMAYRTPWEFVAERFHCDEAYLRKLNPSLPAHPLAGSKFVVPNVTPFEIEKLPSSNIQPPPEPQPITASISSMSVLEIYRGNQLVAAMPLSKARPALTGRGEWKILNAVSRPRMTTFQEPRVIQVEKTGPFYVNPNPTPVAARAVMSSEQFLPAGPNNPVGILWLNLAKGDSAEPLPFGLHGTSTPAEMYSLESIGGLRLSNSDILRAAQLLPVGTKLEWKP